MEKNEKKKISCSYALLVVVLFATVCFLVDYIVIDRKLNENKGGSSTNTNVSENTNSGNNSSNVSSNSSVQYTYNNIAGKYSVVVPNFIEEWDQMVDAHYTLELFTDGTYYYSHSVIAASGEIGNYIINDNSIVLNKFIRTGSDVGLHSSYENRTLIINENGNIIDAEYESENGGIILEKQVVYSDNDNDTSSFKSVLDHGILDNRDN